MCFLTETVQPVCRNRKTFLALNNVASYSSGPFKFVFFDYALVRLVDVLNAITRPLLAADAE